MNGFTRWRRSLTGANARHAALAILRSGTFRTRSARHGQVPKVPGIGKLRLLSIGLKHALADPAVRTLRGTQDLARGLLRQATVRMGNLAGLLPVLYHK